MPSLAPVPGTPGLLSQSIRNLQQMLQQIQAIHNLPASAIAVENAAQNELTTDISKIQATQKSINGYCASARTAINQALADLSAGKDLSVVLNDIKASVNGVHTMQQGINGMNTTVKTSKNQLIGLEQQLTAINTHLTNQIISLQVHLTSEEQSIAAKRKNYLYLLALGPFGLIGLAAAGIAIAVQEGQIASLRGEMAKQQATVAQTRMLQVGMSHLGTTMSSIVNGLSTLKNAIDFLAGDLDTIATDLTTGKNSGQLQIYLHTALSQITSLEQDAR
jgi:hypothetical protein